jgi:beta-galactosidase/beta-glucuronidase
VVDAPHDSLIATPYSPTANNGQGSIPKNVSWYRKRLVLPAAWEGSHVSVYFEGVFAHARTFFNGQELNNHTGAGYTSFAVRLDNATTVHWGAENVLAVYCDSTAAAATGWW